MCGMKGLPPLKNATVGCVLVWTASFASRAGRMCVGVSRIHIVPQPGGCMLVPSTEDWIPTGLDARADTKRRRETGGNYWPGVSVSRVFLFFFCRLNFLSDAPLGTFAREDDRVWLLADVDDDFV